MSSQQPIETTPDGFLAKPRFPFPVCSPESERWDIVHNLLRLAMGGLYSNPELVKAALETDNPRVLDVGTGTGTWAIEMGNELRDNYPGRDGRVIGIDLIQPASRPNFNPKLVSENTQFQLQNANMPLDIQTGSVNVIHARMLDHGIRDYPTWLSEVTRVLRPNGVYLVIIGILGSFDEKGDELPTVPKGEQGYTGFQNLLSATAKLVYDDRNAPVTRDCWKKWMQANRYFNKADRNPNLVQPLGPWKDGSEQSILAQEDALRLIDAMVATLLNANPNNQAVNTWATDAKDEITTQRTRVSMYWASACGVRSGELWSTTP